MIPKLSTREAFLEAFIHDEHVIWGRTLLPFCLDHWAILDALQSPLIHGGTITQTDIQLAVKACSTRSTEEFYEATRRPKFGWQVWNIITSKAPLGPALEEFNLYVDDYIPNFPRWQTDETGDAVKCPPLFVCAAKLVSMGHETAKVRRMPIGEILAWNLAISEAKGEAVDDLMSESDLEAVKEIEKEALNG